MIRNSLLLQLNPHPRPFSLREKGAKHALEVPLPEGEGLRVRVITPNRDLVNLIDLARRKYTGLNEKFHNSITSALTSP
jgi:hypothetical protein